MTRYRGKHAEPPAREARGARHAEEAAPETLSPETVRRLKRKNAIKTVKYVIQLLLVAGLLLHAARMTFFGPRYKPTAAGTDGVVAAEENKGTPAFVAVSYFGAEKFESNSDTLIAQSRLKEHLAALKMNGYVTVSQQDVINYYAYRGTLPKRALFLFFEDGRRDTAALAQPLLERYNYLATANTYADKFETKDGKFLSAADLKTLRRSSFWELGTNGYRLSYINVFDRYENYFGHLNSNEFITVHSSLKRDYNHYLMDFLRDEDRIREESIDEMKLRIRTDYELMQKNYIENVGYLPEMYTLMHSNTGAFGTDPLVSNENRNYITSMFPMNFNREGSCMNSLESSVYDLTRMQPQANWYANHLLMRIKDDMQQEVKFVVGDEKGAADWTVTEGAAEFRKNTIALTSESYAYGRMALNGLRCGDVRLTVTLGGNAAGNQGVWVRADRSMENGVYVGLENNQLIVREYVNGTATELYRLDLFEFYGGAVKSVEEDEHEGLLHLQEAILQYDESYERMQNAQYEKEQLEKVTPASLEDGAEPYEPVTDIIDRATRKLEILLADDALRVTLDGMPAADGIRVSVRGRGTVALEASALIQEEYSQRNLADDVYDGVFTDLTILDPENGDRVYYAYRLNGIQRAAQLLRRGFEKLTTFFADTF